VKASEREEINFKEKGNEKRNNDRRVKKGKKNKRKRIQEIKE
jgi:hypothetical protein